MATRGSHPALDPDLVGALRAMQEECGGVTWTQDKMIELRKLFRAASPSPEMLRREGRIQVEERVAAGLSGGPQVPMLILRPVGQTAPAPAFYNTHSGGMVMGCNRDDMAQVSDWVERFGAVALSPEYRLSPEHPFPAGLEDCWAGLVWSWDNAAELGIDPDRIVLSGISAGGGIAASLALQVRDRGGPRPIGQLLTCPMLDDRAATPSSYELEGEGIWDRASNLAGWRALLGDARGGPEVPPYAAAARADDLSGLPPAFLDVGSVDVLRDEITDYARAIWQAAGSAELHVWPGGFHGFDACDPEAPLSRAALAARVDWLTRLLAA